MASRVTQVRVGTQARLLTGSEVGLGHLRNLSKMWTLFSLNFLHLQSGSNIYLARRFVAKTGIYGKYPAVPAHSKCSVNGSCPGQCAPVVSVGSQTKGLRV